MNSEQNPTNAALRIVTLNNYPGAFEMVRQWAERSGHQIVLVVTTPGPKTRRSQGFKEIAATAGELNLEVLITTRLKTVATPILQMLKPDLIVSFTFPWLIPPGLRQAARIGAVNLHPSLLPAYRGPNPIRQFYDAAPMVGATMHWTDDEFDTGRILSQQSAPLPKPCTFDTINGAWFPAMAAAFEEGVARAIAGDPGDEQPTAGASYAAAFSEAEGWLDFSRPAFSLQCQAAALNYFGAIGAKAHIAGQDWLVERLDLLEDTTANAKPGSLIEQLEDGLIVQAGDGAVKIKATPSQAASV